MFGGGIADKFGNAYEARWAVRQLLDVFRAESRSIRLEGISAAFRGFEFAVDHGDRVSWHQTKINAPGQNWTIRALEQEGVLSAFASRLGTSAVDRCVFVSQSPAADLFELAGKASYASDFADFDQALPATSRGKFEQFRTALGISAETAFDWLCRCDFRTLPEQEVTGQIEAFGSVLFDGSPAAVYPALRGYLEERLNRDLSTELVRSDILAATPLRLKLWSLDPTLRERIRDETNAYLETYTPFGAASHVISRPQSDQIVAELGNAAGARVILVGGVAGSGKSGVIRDVLAKLANQGTLSLAFRIDQHLTSANPAELGEALLGRTESLTTTLKGMAPDETTVLLIDQVDAVSEVSGRNGAAKNTILRMVDEARRYGTVRVVIVCRSFDIESDERIKQLRQSDDVVQIDVPLLDWTTEVAPVVGLLGVVPEDLDATQRSLLCLPLNLAVFAEIAGEGDTQFASRNDLFAKLLQRKERLVAQLRDQVGWPLMAPLAQLADWMSERQRLDAPFSVLDNYARSVEILASEHLIVRSRGTVNFFHESFFDYVFARSFSARAQRVVDLLASTEQHLFRRTQVRQILESLRQSDQSRYLRELRELLGDPQVRFHIRVAIAQWLSALAAPTKQERDLLLDLDDPTQPISLVVRTALLGSPGWFDVLNSNGWLASQLRSPVETRARAVLWWLGNIAGSRPAPIAQLLEEWWDGNPDRGSNLLEWFSYVRRQGPDQALIDLCVRVIESRPPSLFSSGDSLRRELLIATWAAGGSEAGAARVLRAYFNAWFEAHPDKSPFEREAIRDVDLHSLAELEKKAPLAFLDGTIDALAKALEIVATKTSAGEYDSSFRHRARTGHNFGGDQYLRLASEALKEVALKAPEEARRVLHHLDPISHEAAAHLYLEAISANGQALATELLPLLGTPVAFEAGWVGAKWRSLADAAKAALPFLGEADRASVEAAILTHWPELEFASASAKEFKAAQDKATTWITPKRIVSQLSFSGYEQFCILETIGGDLLGPQAVERLNALRRKFRGRAIDEPSHVSAYTVGSPIPKDDAKHMTDEQWLSAMHYHNSDNERRHGNDRVTGGALQLAQVLQQLTKQEPDRFAKLQLRIPNDANPAFIRQLLWGLAEAEAVPSEDLEASIVDAHHRPGRPFGQGIARLVEKYPELGRAHACWDALVWYILNGDAPESDEIDERNVERERISIDTLLDRGGRLYVRGLNGTRGWALEALSSVLWRVPERQTNAWDLLEGRIETEQLVSVRCCIPRPLTPLFNADKTRCASLLERLIVKRANHTHEHASALGALNFPPAWIPLPGRRLLAAASQALARRVGGRNEAYSQWLSPLITQPATELLPYIIHNVPAVGRRLLSKLLFFGDRTMRLIATWHVIRSSYNDVAYVPLADTLENESVEARRLAADIAAHAAVEETLRDRAKDKLRGYFEDGDEDVRREAAGVFRDIPSNQFIEFMDLARAYVASRAFETESFPFLHALESATCNVAELVISAAERVLREARAVGAERGGRDMDFYQLKDLLKTEYAASEDSPELRKRLLDVIDGMLMLELHGTDEIVGAHER